MKIETIDWEDTDFEPNDECGEDCTHAAIKCPACGRAWLTDYHGEYDLLEETGCPHLRFWFVDQDEEIHYFNGYTEQRLLAAIEPAARQLSPELNGLTLREWFFGISMDEAMRKIGIDIEQELTKDNLLSLGQLDFHSKRFNEDLWKLVHDPDLDTILSHTDCGIACGPVSFTTFYGVKLH